MNDSLLTSRQVAERMRTTVTTVNRWVAAGRLEPVLQVPGYRGARLFDPASIDAMTEGITSGTDR